MYIILLLYYTSFNVLYRFRNCFVQKFAISNFILLCIPITLFYTSWHISALYVSKNVRKWAEHLEINSNRDR